MMFFALGIFVGGYVAARVLSRFGGPRRFG